MRRRSFVFCGLAALLLAAGPAAGQQAPPGKVPRVGVLSPQNSTEPPSMQREPFDRGLRALGWTPGSNILIEYRYAEGSTDRLAELAAELARTADVIVARGTLATQAARQATDTVPIVMAVTPDPVGSGFVASLARPGRNITGLSFLPGEPLEAKRIELLKEAVPGLTRVAILTNPINWPDRDGSLARDINAAANALGLEVETFEVRAPSALPEVFAAIARARVGALMVRGDPQILEPHRAEIVALAREHRLPAIYGWRHFVEAGGLMSYAASLADLHRRSASYVDKILKGAKPADLPVEQPTKFELVINSRTAKALGIIVPDALLDRADEVIE